MTRSIPNNQYIPQVFFVIDITTSGLLCTMTFCLALYVNSGYYENYENRRGY